MTITPPFKYFGSKFRISKKIIEHFPPHACWVEAFCGSAAITLQKKPAQIEIINDLDGNIVNVFRQLRENPDELLRLIELTPYAKEELDFCRTDTEDKLEKARRFIVCAKMSVNATSGFSFSNSFSIGKKEMCVNTLYNLPSKIKKVIDRLKKVRIENRDAFDLIKHFENRPNTLIYIDPPYLMKRSGKYNIDANYEEFHVKLLNLCKESNAMIMVSSYNNDLYDKNLSNWGKVEIETRTASSDGASSQRTEVIWKNQNLIKAFESNKLPLVFSKYETKKRKVNPERFD